MRIRLSVTRLALVFVAGATCSGTAQSNSAALIAEGTRLLTPAVARPERAVALFEDAERIAQQHGDREHLARALVGLVEALWMTDRFDRALATAERAQPLVRATGDLRLEANLIRHKSSALLLSGRLDAAVDALEISLTLARRGRAFDAEALALNNLSALAISRGRLPDAIRHARAAVDVVDRAQADDQEISRRVQFAAPYNLGKSLANAGDLLEAATFFDRAFQTAQRNQDVGAQHHVLFDTAEWYEAQGDVARAERYYMRAVEYSDRIAGVETRAKSLRGLAGVALSAGNAVRATTLYAESLRLFEQGQFGVALPLTLVRIARARRLAGQLGEARKDAERAERLAREARQLPPQVLAWLELARHARTAGTFSIATAHATAALRLAEEGGLRPAAIAALVERAEIAREEDRIDHAVGDYRRAIALINRIRGRITSPELRATFAEASHAAYEGLVDALLVAHARAPAAGFERQALMVIEEERARNLVDALNGAFADRSREVPPALGSRRRELHAQLASLQQSLQPDTLSAAERQPLMRALDDAERDLAVLDASSPGGIASALSTVPRDIGELQRSLSPEEAVLHYVTRPDRGWVYIITAERVALAPLDLPSGLDDRVAVFSGLLASGRGREALAAGRVLARALIEPLAPYVPASATRLIISATGSQAALPFAALPVDHAGSTVPLLAKYEIAMDASLTALSRIRRRGTPPAQRAVLAFGEPARPADDARHADALAKLPPLPASVREARRAAGALSDSTLRVGQDATEAVFREPSGVDYRVIHFASHAVLDEDVPERSAIVLAPAPGLDGLLQPREIFDAGITADLVVLGACRTAAGRSSQAEGLQSLARAFLYAGSRSVVGTLWPVSDRAAADLMQRFYDELARGSAAGAALRRAQLAMAGRDPYATASHWAGYVITGDPLADPQLRSNAWRPPLGWSATLLGAIVVVTLFSLAVLWRVRPTTDSRA